jgi:hypothetical protein
MRRFPPPILIFMLHLSLETAYFSYEGASALSHHLHALEVRFIAQHGAEKAARCISSIFSAEIMNYYRCYHLIHADMYPAAAFRCSLFSIFCMHCVSTASSVCVNPMTLTSVPEAAA